MTKWRIREFTSQVQAQSFVKQLIRKGHEAGFDIRTYNRNDKYIVEYVEYVNKDTFGIFGA